MEEYKPCMVCRIIFVIAVIGVFIAGLFVIPNKVQELYIPSLKRDAIEVLFYMGIFWLISVMIITVYLFAVFRK